MIISVVLVSMMVVFVTVYHFVTKPKKQQEKIYSAMTTDELIRFVQSMHCELVKRIDADAIIITRVRDKDCVKNRVKRAKIVRFTLC